MKVGNGLKLSLFEAVVSIAQVSTSPKQPRLLRTVSTREFRAHPGES